MKELSGNKNSISVALCTYQGARYLPEQLESIAAQTRQPDELVVCDDGSRDETLSLLTDFASQVSFPVHIHRNEVTLGSTRNFEKAIRLCRGEYIALSDQDDWWHPKKLETLSEVFGDQTVGAVFTNGLLMNSESKLTGSSLWDDNFFAQPDHGFGLNDDQQNAQFALLKNNMVTGATVIFRASLRDVMLPFPAEWIHDGWIAWMLVLHSRLRAVAEPLIHYRTHQNQQVGVPGRSLKARLTRARATGSHDYASIEKQFGILIEYVESQPALSGTRLLRQLQDKKKLMGFRARLPKNRIERWAKILAQARSYHAYAQGTRSMFKDALV